MLPSLLTRDIHAGLKQYLLTAYEPADGYFRGVMERFLNREGSWMKGPYVQVGLPFRLGLKGCGYFSAFETRFPGYAHQEAAWERLNAKEGPQNTLVATGTGSGKTECFLYPVLDHCARESAVGNHGIKALIIYPMNALATDQARRIAELIASVPAFKHLRTGIYVGGLTGGEGGGTVMTPGSVITDRETLRTHPPDILLTNYKMLDYLLIRPKDRGLWAQNQPDTLRYIVVDELHTFDGAQGTDLALLLRRLKARLKAETAPITHIGTSATLGNSTDTAPLRNYAAEVFGAPFSPESVVIENRLNVREFLGDDSPEYLPEAKENLERLLSPAKYRTQEEAVAAWFPLFFPGELIPADVHAPEWRQKLGVLLKRHALFSALLRVVQGGATPFAELQTQLAGQVPAAMRPHIALVLDALLVLVAWGRSADSPDLPLVTLRVQVWVRELRRMVALLTPNALEVELRLSSELSRATEGIYLPLIQCSDCHTTAWLSKVANLSENKLSTNLEEIYADWFAGAVNVVRLYPECVPGTSQTLGILQFACTDCGLLNGQQSECSSCGGERLIQVFRPTGQSQQTRGNATTLYNDSTCPVCGADHSLLLIGSRSTTLGAQVVEQSWGSVYNDDRKMIAFSDSVQDAAHRSGFIGARTYIYGVRNALAKGIAHLVRSSMPWQEFRTGFDGLWRETGSPLFMDPAQFVAEFIGPNMTWRRAWTDLYNNGATFSAGSPLPNLVQKRLGWQAFAEFTYAGNRGRNLERIGVATLAPYVGDISDATLPVLQTLRQSFGIDTTEETVFWWLWGFVNHLRRIGAVEDPAMGNYPADGNLFALTQRGERADWMPKMGFRTLHPTFLSLGNQRDFDPLLSARVSTWYKQWLDATIAQDAVLISEDRLGIYRVAITELEKVGVLKVRQNGPDTSVGLNPARLRLCVDVLCLQTETSTRTLIVPADTAIRGMEMACPDAPGERYTRIVPAPSGQAQRLRSSVLRRVIPAEHTGLLERPERERLEVRFKSNNPQPWYENLLSATPTLEMGVDIGDLSSVMLCSVPPTVASFLQRIGRAGRRDGNAHATTLVDGASPHDLYFYEEPSEMLAGDVAPPGIFLQAPEVLRRQYFSFCLDDWVSVAGNDNTLPEKTSRALDAIDSGDEKRFPYNFIAHTQKHQVRLFDAFLALLGDNATEEVTKRLLAFVEGAEGVTPLRVRLISALGEIATERKAHSSRVKELRARLRLAKLRPQDEAQDAEIGEIEQEEGKFQELVAEINARELLNTLTDAGLIPNYAFPEAGVELKSILWRRATPEDRTQSKYVSLKAQRYERPASSALSEFAPENRFYANQRRVEIDQINMGLAKLETWRLCPNCHHMENLSIVADDHVLCPLCQDAMWSDSAQKRQLLRFRQAIANSNDTNVRIDDSVEEREPKFYLRQLLVDFAPEDVREAWMLQSNQLPFGFEFIASASFRDINFGESSKPGDRFRVADRDEQRPGFRLCSHCGKVQSPPRRTPRDGDDPKDHALDCVALRNPDSAELLNCLYLYREFQSEALRILVPFTRLGVDDPVVQSFSAALQVGLKRRFGGQVDHLRVMTQEMPDPEGGPKRRYLLLYDSVPGGTGYLHQLLAHDARTLKEVFQMALVALEECPCQSDPAKDGCYRCVYQYRLGRSMELVSRRIALSVLRELVAELDNLERTETISGIALNHALESVLERRFLESLRRLSSVDNLPRITLIQEIVNGREGYHLQVGENTYTIELQVDLNASQGVKRASRPDFVIRPLSSTSKRKPIAVFCDGWTYHKDILRDDAAKRTAIVNSGKYWVWSVVMDDVEVAIQCKSDSVLPVPYQAKVNNPGMPVPAQISSPSPSTFTRNAVAELLHWLAQPAKTDDSWVNNAWLASMGWLMRLYLPDAQHTANMQAQNTVLRNRLPLWLPPVPPQTMDVGLKSDAPFDICGVWSPVVHASKNQTERLPNIVWFDDTKEVADADRRLEWRWWLWAFNWLQTVRGSLLVTEKGIHADDYVGLNPAVLPAMSGGGEASQAVGQAWEDALNEMLNALTQEAQRLVNAGCPAPEEVGYTLTNDQGDELSMAELAWVTRKIAILSGDYELDQEIWQAAGWKALVVDSPWAAQVKVLLLEESKTV